MISVRAHAKINLNLRVLGVRPDDGYHDLRTVFQSLALHDTLRLVQRPGRFAIESNDPRVPLDENNLVWRAAAMLWEHLRRPGQASDVLVEIDKCIPMKGGLGGGSADAAAALVGLARLWDADVPADELRALGRRLGADVAFFFTGGAALGEGRGDQLYPLPDLAALGVLLVIPAFDVSTAEAYRWIDEARGWGASPEVRRSGSPSLDGARDALSDSRRAEVRTSDCDGGAGRRIIDSRTPGLPDARTVTQSIPRCPWPEPLAEVVNDFEAVVAARHPELGVIVSAMSQAGAVASAMTGSGSTVFGLFENEGRTAAAAAQMGRFGRVLATKTLGRAEYLELSVPRQSAGQG